MNDEHKRANSNCLTGTRCPRCGSYEPFTIYGVSATAVVCDQGVEEVTGFDWDAEASCLCEACQFRAQAMDFEDGSLHTYVCGNCQEQYQGLDALWRVQDPELRVDPGGPVSAGECPACEALCYLQAQRRYLVTVLAVSEDPETAPIRLGTQPVNADNPEYARKLAVSQLWEPRLEASGCSSATAVSEESDGARQEVQR